jgi:hypothetical protein
MFARVYMRGLVKGAENVVEIFGTAVMSLIVSVPVVGLFANSMTPVTLKCPPGRLHGPGIADSEKIEQLVTIAQLVVPAPGCPKLLCKKVTSQDRFE